MPMYEYECAKCGTRFEQIQKFSDPPVKKHDGCGGKVRRLLSAPAIQFKGAGWYITDYARAGKTDGAKAEDKAGAEAEKKTAAKAEAKESKGSDSSSGAAEKTAADSSKK